MALARTSSVVRVALVQKRLSAGVYESLQGFYLQAEERFSSSLPDASRAFNELLEPTVFAWSAIISASVRHGEYERALSLYNRMIHTTVTPDEHVFVAALNASANIAALTEGQLIHAHAVCTGCESEVFISNALVDLYTKCGILMDAVVVVDNLPTRDVVTWNSLIAGHARHGRCQEVFQYLKQMQRDGIMPNTATWNSIIAGYTDHGNSQGAFVVFERMQEGGWRPDCFTFASMLKACSSLADVSRGNLVLAQLVESGLELDAYVCNALIDMYVKCGSLEEAYRELHRLAVKDVVAWTAVLTGYVKYGHSQKALQTFHEMQGNGNPDHLSFMSALQACTSAVALEQGKLIHAQIIESGMELHSYVRSTLIDMYAKCGSLESASRTFDRLVDPDMVAWSTMIAGFCMHNCHKLALHYFQQMLHAGFCANSVIFLCLLSSCAHLGLVYEGCHLFLSMKKVHGITPSLEHFNCMVEILGRAGNLTAAEDILKSVPFCWNLVGWISLLGNCRRYCDVGVARRCFDHAVAIDKDFTPMYILMSKIYADGNMWEEADKIEEMKSQSSVFKVVGTAHIEINNKICEFHVGDETDPCSSFIYAKLRQLDVLMEEGLTC